MKCCNCEKAAVLTQKNTNTSFCLDCWEKYCRILTAQNAESTREINHYYALAEAMVGLPLGTFPRLETPRAPTIHTGDVTLNSIKIDKSVVGSINTGEIQNLNVALKNVQVGGDEPLAKSLRDFADAVLTEKNLSDQDKNKIIEHTSFIAEQAALPKDQRKPGIIRMVVSDISNLITISGVLPSLWSHAQPLIQALLS